MISYVVSNYFVDTKGICVIDTIFHCKIEKTVLNISASAREVPEYYWLSAEQIRLADDSPEWLKKYISYIEDGKK